MIFSHKKVLVFGTGISGISAINLLQNTKADIILYDSNKGIDKDTIFKKLPKDFNGQIIIGDFPKELSKSIDYVILSPGVPADLDLINELRDRNIPIIGEVELAFLFEKGKVVAITGTNGKTTTTTLVGKILKSYYESVFVVGNIGIPYTQLVLDTKDSSITVAEVSSFQLETIKDFKPHISAILNITPDHLDRHYTLENYFKIKSNIVRNQKENDICILNYDDKILKEFGEKLDCKVIYFSSTYNLKEGIYLENDNIIYSNGEKRNIICSINELHVFGKHNYENIMAAVAIGVSLDIPLKYITTVIKDFVGVEHRIEYVAKKEGVKYYNDSKGTNPDASIKAIEAMPTPTVLIAGGYDKGSEFDKWIQSFGDKITYLILLGETKEKIAKTAKEQGFNNIFMVDTLEEAVKVSARYAKEGESVLLSPACASWGMFKNYEERGNLFKRYVNDL